jgi:hypothetical protein
MCVDPEDPMFWEEKFGNFNLARFGEGELSQPPKRVRPVKPLGGDIRAMLELIECKEVPTQDVRPRKLAHAITDLETQSKMALGRKCEGTWCGACFRLEEDEDFPIQVPINDGRSAVLVNVKDERMKVDSRLPEMVTIWLCASNVKDVISTTSRAKT